MRPPDHFPAAARGVTLVAVLLSTACAAGRGPGPRARALEGLDPDRQGFEVDPIPEVVGTAALWGLAALLDRDKGAWKGVSPCSGEGRVPTPEELAAYEALRPGEGACDPSELPALDRWVARQRWPPALWLSDVGLTALMTAPFVFAGVDRLAHADPFGRFSEDALVVAQTLGATLLATNVAKHAARRPRPLTYNPDIAKAERFGGDARLSFPSGHTSASFAGASALSVMLVDRYGWGVGGVLGVTASYTSALAVGALRVVGGKHFPTDVLAGALIGTALGLAIPALHLADDEIPPGQTGAALRRQHLGYQPVFSLGGAF